MLVGAITGHGTANVTERPCVRACMKNPSPTPDRSWARSTLTHRSGRAIAHFSSVQEGCARAYVPASLTLVSSCGSSHHGCIITISLAFSPACALEGGYRRAAEGQTRGRLLAQNRGGSVGPTHKSIALVASNPSFSRVTHTHETPAETSNALSLSFSRKVGKSFASFLFCIAHPHFWEG